MKIFVVSRYYQESQTIGVFTDLVKAIEYAKSEPEGYVTEWTADEFSPAYPFEYRRDDKIVWEKA